MNIISTPKVIGQKKISTILRVPLSNIQRQQQCQAERHRAAPDRTRQGREGPGKVRATKGRSVLERARQELTGPGMISRTGQGGGKGSVSRAGEMIPEVGGLCLGAPEEKGP